MENILRELLEVAGPVLDNSEYEIIVNDCSTDFTEKILENYKYEVRVFNLKNIGLSAARKFGIKQSKGQFVVFLDADDYFHNQINIEKLFLEENNELDAVSVDYYQVDERGT